MTEPPDNESVGQTPNRNAVKRDWPSRARELAAASIAAGEPDAWFDQLYAESAAGEVTPPWGRNTPMPQLTAWIDSEQPSPSRAVVVGCGLGADAEYLAMLGFDVTGFDLSPHAVTLAQQRNPDTVVKYRVADATDLPHDLIGAFDLVVEIFTLQAVPNPPRTAIADGIATLVAPNGTLVVIDRRDTGDPTGPPFQITAADLARLEASGLIRAHLEVDDGLWVATFHRPAPDGDS
ncbi:class I SAM-dependent methyltransferase [Streptomyces sp. NPDC096013]|uniref:class I SAM-dependent methyltransferase n=1 Tax=Streptomyces sp. NPDC096013 TaxID=3366069 RepID=UPI003824F692